MLFSIVSKNFSRFSINMLQSPLIDGNVPALGVLRFSRNFLEQYGSVLPILYLGVSITLLWCILSVKSISLHSLRWILTFIYISLLSIYISMSTLSVNYSIFGTIINANWYILFANISIILFAMLAVWVGGLTINLLLYTGGMVIFSLSLVGAVDLITFYVSFEALSLLTYGIIATNKTVGSSEGALKYFIYGVISSVLLIFGLSLYYITYRSTDWYEVYSYESFDILGLSTDPFIFLSFILVVLAFCYKLSLFPFHFSLPDVYDGSSWGTISIINLIVKLALTLSIFRVWSYFISQTEILLKVSNILLIISILSLIIGCFGALVQTSVKRLFAYTSINQGGFILLGLLNNDVIGLQASLLYLIVYVLTMFVFFIGISYSESEVNNLLDLRYLGNLSKLFVGLSLFSMAGIPPFLGFVSKYWIWVSLVNGVNRNATDTYSALLLIAFITSILVSLIGAYYYLRLIKVYMFENSLNGLDFDIISLLSISAILGLIILLFLMFGWFTVTEELFNFFKIWAADNYGSWTDYIYTGWYKEWLHL